MRNVTITCDNWTAIGDTPIVQDVDGTDVVLHHIRMLDGGHKTLVSLAMDDQTLWVGGGEDGKFVCCYDNAEQFGLVAALGTDETPVDVVVGGQPCDFKERNLLDFPFVEKIVRTYMNGRSITEFFT